MKAEDRAIQYCKAFPQQSVARGAGFEAGAQWAIAEVDLFLLANPRATVEQITEYLKTL